MRNTRAGWVALALLGLLVATTARATEIIDDRGVSLRLARPAQRIVTLAPSLTELAFAAGAGAAVVGVAAYSDYPAEAARLPIVASSGGIDLEGVLAAKPDLVLAWGSGNRPADVQRLEGLGIPVLVTEPRRLSDVPRIVRLLGQAAGTGKAAEPVAQAFDAELAGLRTANSGAREVTVFYQVWDRPLRTIGGTHIIDEMIRLCGGRNVFTDLRLLSPEVALESVMAADPDVLLTAGTGRVEVPAWARTVNLRAVREGHVYNVDPTLVERATPRLAQGVVQICERLARARGDEKRE
ncbi:MAG TPA: cobalamin-binding protein [Burkholderiales bacterium]|nr:cobalamin-binding protein [Burkholderiales bacterium]